MEIKVARRLKSRYNKTDKRVSLKVFARKLIADGEKFPELWFKNKRPPVKVKKIRDVFEKEKKSKK
jgi:hypothetical protein